MSIALLEAATAALGELIREVVFVGGATIGLWITDPAAPEPRPTKDVDVIVEVATRGQFAAFEQRLRERRFREDQGIICRWLEPRTGLILDAMPTDASILGFASRWHAAAVPHAVMRALPSGAQIVAVSPPFLVATKLEAFAGRGGADYVGSRDFADLVSLFDGRAELTEEIEAAPPDLRGYVAAELARHRRQPRFLDGVYGGLSFDAASQDRAERVVVPRMAAVSS